MKNNVRHKVLTILIALVFSITPFLLSGCFDTSDTSMKIDPEFSYENSKYTEYIYNPEDFTNGYKVAYEENQNSGEEYEKIVNDYKKDIYSMSFEILTKLYDYYGIGTVGNAQSNVTFDYIYNGVTLSHISEVEPLFSQNGEFGENYAYAQNSVDNTEAQSHFNSILKNVELITRIDSDDDGILDSLQVDASSNWEMMIDSEEMFNDVNWLYMQTGDKQTVKNNYLSAFLDFAMPRMVLAIALISDTYDQNLTSSFNNSYYNFNFKYSQIVGQQIVGEEAFNQQECENAINIIIRGGTLTHNDGEVYSFTFKGLAHFGLLNENVEEAIKIFVLDKVIGKDLVEIDQKSFSVYEKTEMGIDIYKENKPSLYNADGAVYDLYQNKLYIGEQFFYLFGEDTITPSLTAKLIVNPDYTPNPEDAGYYNFSDLGVGFKGLLVNGKIKNIPTVTSSVQLNDGNYLNINQFRVFKNYINTTDAVINSVLYNQDGNLNYEVYSLKTKSVDVGVFDFQNNLDAEIDLDNYDPNIKQEFSIDFPITTKLGEPKKFKNIIFDAKMFKYQDTKNPTVEYLPENFKLLTLEMNFQCQINMTIDVFFKYHVKDKGFAVWQEEDLSFTDIYYAGKVNVLGGKASDHISYEPDEQGRMKDNENNVFSVKVGDYMKNSKILADQNNLTNIMLPFENNLPNTDISKYAKSLISEQKNAFYKTIVSPNGSLIVDYVDESADYIEIMFASSIDYAFETNISMFDYSFINNK